MELAFEVLYFVFAWNIRQMLVEEFVKVGKLWFSIFYIQC